MKMESKEVNEIMDNITEDGNLCIIRDALTFHNNKCDDVSRAVEIVFEHLNSLSREDKCIFLHESFLDDTYPEIIHD